MGVANILHISSQPIDPPAIHGQTSRPGTAQPEHSEARHGETRHAGARRRCCAVPCSAAVPAFRPRHALTRTPACRAVPRGTPGREAGTGATEAAGATAAARREREARRERVARRDCARRIERGAEREAERRAASGGRDGTEGGGGRRESCCGEVMLSFISRFCKLGWKMGY